MVQKLRFQASVCKETKIQFPVSASDASEVGFDVAELETVLFSQVESQREKEPLRVRS
jgi:hypothetical protein